jgi:hypothetical protein
MEGRNFLLGLFVVLLVASGSVFVVAVTGNCLFHVCEDEAVAIAQEYARGTVEVEAATAGLPVHNVEIKHEGMETAIAIDAHTGEVLAVHENEKNLVKPRALMCPSLEPLLSRPKQLRSRLSVKARITVVHVLRTLRKATKRATTKLRCSSTGARLMFSWMSSSFSSVSTNSFFKLFFPTSYAGGKLFYD